ncbi:MAG: hypothetical protein LC808_13630 [Actinobacteria bacterium]|nr:hypothetical protein [Actinomycetota bacterium]
MSLQRRLTLYFVLIVILPLAIAGVLVQRVVVGELARRSLLSLRPALNSAVQTYNGQVDLLETEIRSLVSSPRLASSILTDDSKALERRLNESLSTAEVVDFLVIRSPSGQVLAAAGDPPDFLSGFAIPSLAEISSKEPGAYEGYTRASDLPIRATGRGPVGEVTGGFWLDQSLLTSPPEGDVELSLVAGDEVIATTAAIAGVEQVDIPDGGQFDVELAGAAKAEAERLPGNMTLVASTLSAPIDARGN